MLNERVRDRDILSNGSFTKQSFQSISNFPNGVLDGTVTLSTVAGQSLDTFSISTDLDRPRIAEFTNSVEHHFAGKISGFYNRQKYGLRLVSSNGQTREIDVHRVKDNSSIRFLATSIIFTPHSTTLRDQRGLLTFSDIFLGLSAGTHTMTLEIYMKATSEVVDSRAIANVVMPNLEDPAISSGRTDLYINSFTRPDDQQTSVGDTVQFTIAYGNRGNTANHVTISHNPYVQASAYGHFKLVNASGGDCSENISKKTVDCKVRQLLKNRTGNITLTYRVEEPPRCNTSMFTTVEIASRDEEDQNRTDNNQESRISLNGACEEVFQFQEPPLPTAQNAAHQTALNQIAGYDESLFSTTPNNRYVAYLTGRGSIGVTLHYLDVQSETVTELYSTRPNYQLTQPTISHDGRYIVTREIRMDHGIGVDKNDLLLIDVQTGQINILSNVATRQGGLKESQISPDGNHIVFVSLGNITGQNGDGSAELFLWSRSSNSIRQVTNVPTNTYYPGVFFDTRGGQSARFTSNNVFTFVSYFDHLTGQPAPEKVGGYARHSIEWTYNIGTRQFNRGR